MAVAPPRQHEMASGDDLVTAFIQAARKSPGVVQIAAADTRGYVRFIVTLAGEWLSTAPALVEAIDHLEASQPFDYRTMKAEWGSELPLGYSIVYRA